MGAKTTMLVVADGDPKALFAAGVELNQAATLEKLSEYFPGQRFEGMGRGDLGDTYARSADEVYIGHFGQVTVLASVEFAHDKPSDIHPHFFKVAGDRDVYTHAMHSVVDFFAFSVRKGGVVVRSFSCSPDNGIMEDLGARLPFEAPFWAGKHPADDPEDLAEPDYEPYPLPFHPLDLGEAALAEFFGYQLEGFVDPTLLDPCSIPLLRFKRVKPAR